jgi:tRNA modification GTPase
LDTAGILDSSEPVEQEGIRRARERAASADLVLWVIDVGASWAGREKPELGAETLEVWLVRNKIDLLDGGPSDGNLPKGEFGFTYSVSAERGRGIEALEAGLADYARSFFAGAESGIVTRARHGRALEDTVAALDRALAEGKRAGREEIVAEELRTAATVLGRLTGRVDVEDILDVIFRDFCIGK